MFSIGISISIEYSIFYLSPKMLKFWKMKKLATIAVGEE